MLVADVARANPRCSTPIDAHRRRRSDSCHRMSLALKTAAAGCRRTLVTDAAHVNPRCSTPVVAVLCLCPSSTPLYLVPFCYTNGRCDLVIYAGKANEKLASGLLEPFLSHHKSAKDQISKGGYSITLRSDASWFTKATLERFVSFVRLPEVLERFVTLKREISQIQESILSNEAQNIDMAMEGNASVSEGNFTKSSVSYKFKAKYDGADDAVTASEENSNDRVHLQRVLETRKAVLRKEQAMAYARALVAGFELEHIDNLIYFAEAFGALRLRFETSEMLGIFLTSTPLPKEAWRVCSTATAMGYGAFVAEQVGGVGYVAFSGVQEMLQFGLLGWDPNCGPNCSMLVALDVEGHGLFAPFKCRYDGEEPVMVHSGVLKLFLHYHSRPDFQSQIHILLAETKSIVITGHSIGGSVAFLTVLWLLSNLKSIFPRHTVLCIGFGFPFLGNKSLSQAILRERWAGSFCNIVSTHDIMPRLSLDQSLVPTPQWQTIIRFQCASMMLPNSMNFANLQLTEEDKAWLFSFATTNMERLVHAGEGLGGRSFWPSGNYLFCSDEGAICLDNDVLVNKMMQLMLRTASPSCIIEEHLRYGWYVETLTRQSLKRSFMEGDLSKSSYEASLSMGLNSLGTSQQVFILLKDCLTMAKRMGRTPNLNAANLAIKLSKITPYRAEIEWYKTCCDESYEQRGYYDSFKQRGASKRESKINMNRFKLAAFWDDVVHMLDRKELPHDLHKREKWVYASYSYMLLVEPLDIAEYYRLGMHLEKGHYISNGRARRYEIFDQWRTETILTKLGNRRTKYASLTQHTCFWARLEEAKEWLDKIRSESDPTYLVRLNEFETYAMKLVEGKEVSVDVVAKNSSFSLWLEKWRALKSQICPLIDVTPLG